MTFVFHLAFLVYDQPKSQRRQGVESTRLAYSLVPGKIRVNSSVRGNFLKTVDLSSSIIDQSHFESASCSYQITHPGGTVLISPARQLMLLKHLVQDTHDEVQCAKCGSGRVNLKWLGFLEWSQNLAFNFLGVVLSDSLSEIIEMLHLMFLYPMSICP